ncbi:MAG: hypothetical protein HPY46_10710 [Candidatus Aminicenantes bacterium]|nr:hypothetical protein [Candidatus Aminicenantes bacterium]
MKNKLILFILVALQILFLSSFLSSEKKLKNAINEFADKIMPNYMEIRANFCFYPVLPRSGQSIKFYNLSTGEPDNYLWSFGDGMLSEEKNPIHKYKYSSVYYVSLRVSKGDIISLINKSVLVISSNILTKEYLKADFIYEPEYPQVGVPIRFIDTSLGNPIKRIWKFGNFDFSFLEKPERIFLSNGTYKVKLTVENQSASDSITKNIEIKPSLRNIVAKSCSFNDIRDAIHKANPGDTVIVPNGSATWSQALIISKGIILKAATKGGVTIISGTASGENYSDPSNFLIAYIPTLDNLGQAFRLSGFILDGNNNRYLFIGKNAYMTPVTKFRMDNCEFKNPKGSHLYFYGEIYGVVDNNTFRAGPSTVTRDFGLNEATWNNFTFDYGTENNRYYEDNIAYFGNYSGFNYGESGARYCTRYNIIYHLGQDLCTGFDMHGNQAGANLATMGAEVYGNVFYVNGKPFRLFGQRGGKGLVYNNTAMNAGGDSYYGGTYIEEYYDYLNPPSTNPAGQPQHISDSYAWNNVVNGAKRYPVIQGTLNYGGEKGIVPRWDIHCFKEVTNFDGSSGIGVGLLSQRPQACTTEGVAWWAIDENKLYRWKNGKWELYYVPYTYPHPLRAILGD